MRNRMIKALKNKYIYVDIDGALSEYNFSSHINVKDGTAIEEIKNHLFLRSRPLKTVIKTLKKVEKRGVWVCGDIISPIELRDKVKWLKENCSDISFNDKLWFVSDEYWGTFLEYFDCRKNDWDIVTPYGIIKGDKSILWDWIKDRKSHSLEDAVFIDDVLSYLKYAGKRGVTVYHISSFIK